MLHTLRDTERRDEGFTLIELLVVVIIIGILAAIAIPVFLNQREKARNSAANSDLRNAITAEEAYYTEHDAYTDTSGNLTSQGLTRSDGVKLCLDTFASASGTADQTYSGLTYNTKNDTAQYYYYYSKAGTIEKSTTLTDHLTNAQFTAMTCSG